MLGIGESGKPDLSLLRASAVGLLDPLVLLEAATDSTGRIVDFVYLAVNTATCDCLGMSREELIGRGVVETMPGIGKALLRGYIRCLDTGEPLVLDDYAFDDVLLRDTRHYDIRVTRTTPAILTLTWRDVTERSNLIRAIAESERTYRLLAENFNDVVLHVRNGAVVWASPSVDAVLGAPNEHWVGRQIRDVVPPEDAPAFDRKLATVAVGGTLKERIRVVSAEGVNHWVDLYATSFFDDAGYRDGFTVAMRVIDREVAAEQIGERARRQKASDDARFKRAMNDSVVGICLITPEGRLKDVNDAMGRIAGIDAAAMNGTHWRDYTAPEYIEEDQDHFSAIIEGRNHSYQMLRRLTRADGGEIWGELSVSAVHDADDHIEGLIALITDVTAEEQTRLELKCRNEENLELIEQLGQQNEQISAAQVTFRLLAENAVDVACHLRDGRFVWVSPSVEAVLGAPPEHWLGREFIADVPPEEVAEQVAMIATVVGGGAIKHRGRVIGVDGVAHWFDLRARPFIGADGQPDGVTATLRLIDTEVAAEQAAKEARRLQARAEALYRRSVDNAAVGMCLADQDGRFVEVNAALCEFFGYDADSLRGKTWQELTAADYLEADLGKRAKVLAGEIESYRLVKQFIHANGRPIWGDLAVSCVRDDDGHVEIFVGQITDITNEMESRQELEAARAQQAATDARFRRSIDTAAVGMCLVTREGRLHDANHALCQFFGREAEAINSMTWQDFGAAEYADEELMNAADILEGRRDSYRMLKHYRHSGGHTIWGDLAVSAVRNDVGDVEYFVVMITDATARVEADRRFRQLMETAAVGMCVFEPSGRFDTVNEAMCRLFGYDAETLKQMTWQELTAPDYLDAELGNAAMMAAGQIDSYRMIKQFIHADGHHIWGDISVSCLREPSSGAVENAIGQIIDVTAEVEGRQLLARRNEQNLILARDLAQQTERLTSSLRNAAAYVEATLPVGLDGPVQVSSRYLPSQELAGDCFDYRWVDNDHLIVYLIDVSGHGIEPALLSMSVHNMLRSGVLPLEILLLPDKVLAELNDRFQMNQQGDKFFSMWFGVYEASTRTLRCASAGAPPAFVFTAEGRTVPAPELSTNCAPVGMFEDTVFISSEYSVPPGCRILLYSDGAFEFDLHDGQRLAMEDFQNLTTRYASNPGSTLDGLIEELCDLTPARTFEDDCSLIEMTFR